MWSKSTHAFESDVFVHTRGAFSLLCTWYVIAQNSGAVSFGEITLLAHLEGHMMMAKPL